jgi:pimeloyl-ACP methyl ester carboxylesterase
LRNVSEAEQRVSVRSNLMTTLVLVPGLVSDQFVWQSVADAVVGDMPVHHADLTQCGSIAEMARGLLASVSGPIIVVGHSMGGRVAMEMVHIAPDRVCGLVLADTGHHPKRKGEDVKRHYMIDLGHKSMDLLVDEWLPPMVGPASVADKDLMAELRAMVLRAGPVVHERQIRALLGRPNATAYLKTIRCPVLLIVGQNDIWSPISQHEEIAATVQDSELVVIEEAGHFAPIERPHEVASAIRGWLARRFGGQHATA